MSGKAYIHKTEVADFDSIEEPINIVTAGSDNVLGFSTPAEVAIIVGDNFVKKIDEIDQTVQGGLIIQSGHAGMGAINTSFKSLDGVTNVQITNNGAVIADSLSVSGFNANSGQITTNLLIGSQPTANSATRRDYVDAGDALKANLAGGNTFTDNQIMTGNLDVQTVKIEDSLDVIGLVKLSEGARIMNAKTMGFGGAFGDEYVMAFLTNKLSFYRSGDELNLYNNGNVTIGLPSDTGEKLQVNGEVKMSNPTVSTSGATKGYVDSFQAENTSITVSPTATTLNAAYPSAPVLMRVYCSGGTGYSCTKLASGWLIVPGVIST